MASVLVVDDHEANRELLTTVLASAGHHVLEASGSEAGLEVALRERPDLIIADILMPAVDGCEFVRRLRGNPPLAATRAVLCTATDLEDEMRRLAARCGVEHFLVTPCEPDEILAVVHHALRSDAGSAIAPVAAIFDPDHMRAVTDRLISKIDELEDRNRRNARQTEQSRSREWQYRLVFDQSPVPMLVYARETFEIVAVNAALVDSYGYSRDELQSMTIRDFLPSTDVDSFVAFLAANPGGAGCDRINGVPAQSWRHEYKDGTVIDVEVATANVSWGARECRVALFLNVTERHREATELVTARDQAVEALNVRSQFLADMSHEIRRPMNGVIDMIELLLDTEMSDEQRFYAQRAARAGEQMMALISDLLDISKIEAGETELDNVDFDPYEAIEQVCAVAGLRANGKGIALGFHIDRGVPHAVNGDCRRLRQVLLNLLSNAVKSTARGAVELHVSAKPRDDATAIRCEVADTGTGIDPAHLDRMFDSSARHHGTGLGLASARELVEAMGGTIGGESNPRRGSTFWFELELQPPSAGNGGCADG